ncbi:MAG: hypothetical protein KKF41_13910 [Actinobacteria bacterium]|nr:hypothetical protein [Actinomycetota bacterium]
MGEFTLTRQEAKLLVAAIDKSKTAGITGNLFIAGKQVIATDHFAVIVLDVDTDAAIPPVVLHGPRFREVMKHNPQSITVHVKDDEAEISFESTNGPAIAHVPIIQQGGFPIGISGALTINEMSHGCVLSADLRRATKNLTNSFLKEHRGLLRASVSSGDSALKWREDGQFTTLLELAKVETGTSSIYLDPKRFKLIITSMLWKDSFPMVDIWLNDRAVVLKVPGIQVVLAGVRVNEALSNKAQ